MLTISFLLHLQGILTFFSTFLISSDDPFTAEVEAAAPTQFAMAISNKAGGYLTDVTIASITSSFVDASGIPPKYPRLMCNRVVQNSV
jgi:hypothetical protein